MLEDKIKVISKTNSTVVVDVPELHLHRVWNKKEMVLPIEKEILAEAIYDPSVAFLFNEGILYIDDLDYKKMIGIESEEATEKEVAIINLTDSLMLRMIKVMPISELNDTLKKLTSSQKEELGLFAIEHNKELQMDRIEILSKYCDYNIMNSISNLNKANEELE